MHEKRSLLVTWHPTAHNILASAGADNMIFIWKVDSAEGVYLFVLSKFMNIFLVLSQIDCHTDLPLSFSWNFDGSLFATTCKEKIYRVILN